MRPSSQSALVFGAAGLCSTLAVLLAGAQQPGCSWFEWMFPAILGLQLCFALIAGFATGYHRPGNWEPVRAGLGTGLVASLSAFALVGLAAIGLLPPVCGEAEYGLAFGFLLVILIFFIAPVAIAGGAAAGGLGGLLAGANWRRVALACALVTGLVLGLLLVLVNQPFGSGVRGTVTVRKCPPDPTSVCMLQPAKAEITVRMPNSQQAVAVTSSDQSGHYQIALKPGTYVITAHRDGFDTGPHAITISADRYLILELDAK